MCRNVKVVKKNREEVMYSKSVLRIKWGRGKKKKKRESEREFIVNKQTLR